MNHLCQRVLVALGCCAVVVAGWSSLAVEPSAAQPPVAGGTTGPPGVTAAPPLALVATRPGADVSRLYLAKPGHALPPPVLEFHHQPGGSVRAAVWSQATVVLATAPATPGRDRSFDGGLYRLDPATGATGLCTGVAHASWPLLSPGGRVFVSRGTAGAPPAAAGTMRIDELTIDEVDPHTGVTATVHHYSGYLAYLAGWHDGKVLVYRVGPAAADIIAVNPDSGQTHVLVPSLPPFARDFSVDGVGGRLVYRGRDQHDAQRWVVNALELADGSQQRLYEGTSFSLAPHVWPGGGVALNPRRQGLRLVGASDTIVSPLGPGVDVIRDLSANERFVAALHTVQGRLPVPFVIDRTTGVALPVATPPSTRVAIAGFVPSSGGSP